jgi:type II secretory pathway pseudopilin PulG
VVVGVLGGLVLAVLLYVVTLNQINSRKSETVRAESEAQQADARAGTLGPFGRFAEVKATREASVKSLAEDRLDWERMVRELALVLPPDTWIMQLDGSKEGDASQGTSGSSPGGQSAPGPSAATSGASGSPTLKLVGCAIKQPDVAVLLVRLRRLHGVDDVELHQSAREEGGGGAQTSGGESGGASSCGNDYKFDLTVTFAANGPTAPKVTGTHKVPATLGGGS